MRLKLRCREFETADNCVFSCQRHAGQFLREVRSFSFNSISLSKKELDHRLIRRNRCLTVPLVQNIYSSSLLSLYIAGGATSFLLGVIIVTSFYLYSITSPLLSWLWTLASQTHSLSWPIAEQ